MGDREIVDKLERLWRSISEVCAAFTEREWKTPTDCPGWSVQDQVSHLVGSESLLLGRPTPVHTPRDLSHVKNEIGRRNEIVVDWRRPWPGAKVLEEFREVTGERLKVLRAMSADDFEASARTPIGPGTMRDLLEIRIFDGWTHEQDIRRAVGRPGHLEGPVAEHSIDQVAKVMPYVVGKRASAPDGAEVVFDITGPIKRIIPIGVAGNRASQLDNEPASPTVRLIMDTETFAGLGCGRWEPESAIRSGKVHVEGDRSLGETIVSQMNFMI